MNSIQRQITTSQRQSSEMAGYLREVRSPPNLQIGAP